MEEKGIESYLLWWKGIHIVGSSGGQTGSHSVWNKHKHERRVQEIIITFGQDSLRQLTGKQMSPVFPCIQQQTKDSYDFPITSRWNPSYGSKLAKSINLNWLWCFPRSRTGTYICFEIQLVYSLQNDQSVIGWFKADQSEYECSYALKLWLVHLVQNLLVWSKVCLNSQTSYLCSMSLIHYLVHLLSLCFRNVKAQFPAKFSAGKQSSKKVNEQIWKKRGYRKTSKEK